MSEAASLGQIAPRVLVVEDEHAVCDILSDIVEEASFDPVCAQSDEEAYEALRGDARFACVIVDVNLGRGTTGYDVARFARTLAPQVAVIYVSGQSSEASFRTNGVPGGVFLQKPFTPSALRDRLRRLLGDNDA
jgi:DNA-binding response OmpR family regulator